MPPKKTSVKRMRQQGRKALASWNPATGFQKGPKQSRPKRQKMVWRPKRKLGGGGVVASLLSHEMEEEKLLRRLDKDVKSSSSLRSFSKLRTNGVQIVPAPLHPSFGAGDRWKIHIAQTPIGRSGIAPFNTDNHVFPFTCGTTACVGQGVYMSSLKAYTYPGSSASQYSSYFSSFISSSYQTDPTTSSSWHTPTAQNIVSANWKFYQLCYFRGCSVRYVPTVGKLTPGTLTFARKYVDHQAGTIDELTFQDIASLPGAVQFPVCETASFSLFPKSDLKAPAIQGMTDPGLGSGSTYWTLVGAIDTPLTTATVDILGHLELDLIFDLYGKCWNADDSTGVTVSREEKRISDVVDRLLKLRLSDPDAKEVKEKKPREDIDWDVLSEEEKKDRQNDFQKKIADQQAYRSALQAAKCCTEMSQISQSTSSASSAVAPNAVSRTPKPNIR